MIKVIGFQYIVKYIIFNILIISLDMNYLYKNYTDVY